MITMDIAVNFIGIIIILTAFEMLSQSYIKPIINTVAIQSILLAIMIGIIGFYRSSIEMILLAILTLVIRGIIVPWLMMRDIRENQIWDYREIETRVSALVILGIILSIIGYAVYQVLDPIFNVKGGALPIMLLLLSFLMIITRKNALAQLTGYIVEENALLYTGVLLVHLPMIIEIGIFLDLIAIIMSGVILAAEKDYGSLELEELVG